MREILFRAKAVCGGWFEGGYYENNTGKYIISPALVARLVIPETVGQFTGLTDRNGTKIFEGDIVSGTAYSSEWIGVIVWIDEIASFGVRYFRRTDPTAWENSSILTAVSRNRQDKFAAQVIGNIYDNPKLLEVKQNG